jgi:glycosyltransferase involved in cell wall biosynthesis
MPVQMIQDHAKKMTHKKPKILTISHYGNLYGANRSLLTLIGALKSQVDWLVICREKGDFTSELDKLDIDYKVLPLAWDVSSKGSQFGKLRYLSKFGMNILLSIYLGILVIRQRIDLIHSNSSVIFIGAFVAFITGRKHLWHIREFVYEDYNLKYNFGRQAFRFWAEKARTLICISKSVYQKRVVDTGIRANSVVIYNGLVHDDTARPKRSRTQVATIGIVGVIDPAKDQLTAIKAVNLLVKSNLPVKLKIIGEIDADPYFDMLSDYVKKHNLENHVVFTGFSKDVEAIYSDLDITLMCSRNEAMGRVTIESMMHGIPVVAYDSAGTSELIEHGQTGLLYKGDEKALAAEVTRLLKDPQLYDAISDRAQTHVRSNFTISQYSKKFLNEVSVALSFPE